MTTSRSPERSIEVVRRLYDALAAGDLDSLMSTLDDRVIVRVPQSVSDTVVDDALGSDPVEPTGLYVGWTSVRRLLAALEGAFAVDWFQPSSLESRGNRVIVCGSFDGWHRRSNCRHTADWVHVFHFDRDKVSLLEVYEASDARARNLDAA